MIRQFVARFRDEIDGTVAGAAIVLGALYVLGFETRAIAVLAGLFVGVPILRGLVEATGFDIDAGLAGLLLGLIVLVTGGLQLLEGSRLAGGAFVAVGCWICADGVDKWRCADRTDDRAVEDDDLSRDELTRRGDHNRRLIETLREADRPLTAEEIRSRTGLTDGDVDRLLEIHGESGPIERVGNGYTVDEDELGLGAALRHAVRSLVGRLLRPFRSSGSSG